LKEKDEKERRKEEKEERKRGGRRRKERRRGRRRERRRKQMTTNDGEDPIGGLRTLIRVGVEEVAEVVGGRIVGIRRERVEPIPIQVRSLTQHDNLGSDIRRRKE